MFGLTHLVHFPIPTSQVTLHSLGMQSLCASLVIIHWLSFCFYSVHIPGIPFGPDHAAAVKNLMMPTPAGIPIVNGRPPLVSLFRMISFMSVIVLSQHFYNVLIFLELSVSSTNQCLLLILCELLLMF